MKYLIIPVLILTLFGCSGNPTAEAGAKLANKKLLEERSPERVDVKVFKDGGAVMQFVWAGTPGVSFWEFADPVLKEDVLRTIENGCGYTKSDIKERRIVEHQKSMFYEVWVFNDPKSKRRDKTTGMSIILTFPQTGGTDISLVGKCHA